MYDGEYELGWVVNKLTNEKRYFHGWIQGFAMVSDDMKTPYGIRWDAFRTNFIPCENNLKNNK